MSCGSSTERPIVAGLVASLPQRMVVFSAVLGRLPWPGSRPSSSRTVRSDIGSPSAASRCPTTSRYVNVLEDDQRRAMEGFEIGTAQPPPAKRARHRSIEGVRGAMPRARRTDFCASTGRYPWPVGRTSPEDGRKPRCRRAVRGGERRDDRTGSDSYDTQFGCDLRSAWARYVVGSPPREARAYLPRANRRVSRQETGVPATCSATTPQERRVCLAADVVLSDNASANGARSVSCMDPGAPRGGVRTIRLAIRARTRGTQTCDPGRDVRRDRGESPVSRLDYDPPLA